MEDFTAFKIQDDSHVLVTFADRELVDCDQADRFERSLHQPAAQMPFEDFLNRCPAEPKQQRNMFDRSDPAQIHDETLENLDVAPFAYCKCNWLSKFGTASSTELLVPVKYNELPP
jgi:hypothetical protein